MNTEQLNKYLDCFDATSLERVWFYFIFLLFHI